MSTTEGIIFFILYDYVRVSLLFYTLIRRIHNEDMVLWLSLKTVPPLDFFLETNVSMGWDKFSLVFLGMRLRGSPDSADGCSWKRDFEIRRVSVQMNCIEKEQTSRTGLIGLAQSCAAAYMILGNILMTRTIDQARHPTFTFRVKPTNAQVSSFLHIMVSSRRDRY